MAEKYVKLSLLLCPYLLFEGKGFYCSQDNGWESPTRSQLTEREIQISSEAISVTNTAFVGEGVIMIVAAWTHLRGVGWGSL